MRLDIVAFTSKGCLLAEKILGGFPGSQASVIRGDSRRRNGMVKTFDGSLHDWVQTRFKTGSTLVFIGAAGIAVRAVAPYVRDKSTDAAVICIDEGGENVIPLLSGHTGGANRAAKRLAEAIHARAVITTATDINGVFAVDAWVAKNNCDIADTSAVKHISAALLDGETVGLRSEFEIEGKLPSGVSLDAKSKKGIEIALNGTNTFPHTVHLIPRIIVAGIGCRKGISADALELRLREALARLDIPIEAVNTVASIDIKAEEQGLLELCERINAGFVTFNAEELMSVEGEFAASERVLRETGADNVCERAVVRAGARIILNKSPGGGITIALGRLDWKVSFN